MHKNSILKSMSIVVLMLSIFIVSCKKDIVTPTTPTATPAPTTPTPGDADGVLAAVRTKISVNTPVIGIVSYDIGMGLAAFGSTSANFAAGTYTDAGAISANSKALTKQSNNSYLYQLGTSDVSGIDFSSNVSWSVAGAGTIPAFTKNLGNVFPTFPTITSGTTIDKTANFTITHDAVSGADSILYVITSGNNTLKKTLSGVATSCTFTATELSVLANTTTALIQVNAYNAIFETVSGKKIYYINMATDNKMPSTVQ